MQAEQKSSAEQVSTEPIAKPKRIRLERTDHDPDLEWFLGSSESAMGAKGTLAGVIGQCERGSVGGSGTLDGVGSYIHPYTDQQLGFGRWVSGDVERHRWLSAAWHALTSRSRTILLCRYSAASAELREDEGYGARDRFVEGSDRREGQHGRGRTGTIRLQEVAGLAFMLADNPGALLLACREPDPVHVRKGLVVVNRALQAQRARVRSEAIKAARAVSLEAHAEWFESKAGADPMRTMGQRTGRGSKPGGGR